jgi:hypothetical protein
MKIYVACALTHVPRISFEEYVSFIHHLVQALQTMEGNNVSYALVNSDPQLAEKPFDERARLCYAWDRELIQQADLVIAEASYPSTGMGVELQIAEAMGVPVIICFNSSIGHRASPIAYENPDHSRHTLQIGEGYVSLMALGLPTVFKVISYQSAEEGIRGVLDAVALIEKNVPRTCIQR